MAIIQDCRFENEVKAARKAGAKIIKLTRSFSYDIHESEQGLDRLGDVNYDLIIDNEFLTIKEKNQAILDALYSWGWLSGHVALGDQ